MLKKKDLIYAPIIAVIFLLLSTVSTAENLDLGIRYLKLGNTYREAGNFEKSADYLNKGKMIIEKNSSWKGQYWKAVSYEYFGYLFNDISMPDLSEEYFEKALTIYRRILSQSDGSQTALEEIEMNIENIRNMKSSSVSAIAGLENTLNYDNLKLRDLPDGIPEDAKNLSLANNKFRDLPSGIDDLTELRYLNLANNKIKDVSDDLADLKNLHWIDLSNNRIKELPEEISELEELAILNLEGNRIKELPASIVKMKNLKILNLKDNKLEFDAIKSLIQNMPNTNIIHDEYVRKDKMEVDDYLDIEE